jgi:CRISPR-associated protein Csh1
VIHQFAELGQYYREREGIGDSDGGQLALYAQDPAQKFRTSTVLLLIFTDKGFEHAQVEQYDDSKRLLYLYRSGSPNGWDATPTSGLRQVKKKTQVEFDEAFNDEVRKKLARLGRSVADGLQNNADLAGNEKTDLEKVRDSLLSASENSGLTQLTQAILTLLPPESKKSTIASQDAIISIAWEMRKGDIKRVGDFSIFQKALVRQGLQSASSNKGIGGEAKGIGQCSICGKTDVEVYGKLQIPNFKLYTLDKPGSISGGFAPLNAWRNFPACRECCDRVDFAGERVKKHLSFNYYGGFKYLFLPSPVQPARTAIYEFLDRLTDVRINRSVQKRLTAAEDEILYVLAQERNVLQVDLLFYQPDRQFFRPALYVPGLLPTRFRKLFEAKDRVDEHPWLKEPSPRPFTTRQFTFGSLENIFPVASGFGDDFLAATRAALELRQFSPRRMLQIGMRWVQQDYRNGNAWPFRLADLFRCILFFEVLTESISGRSKTHMNVDYGNSEQADRVRGVLGQASGRLQTDPAAQAAFLVGACCSRIEMIQQHDRGAAPFAGKLKGFRLSQPDVQRLFVAAKDKAKAYGPDEEKKVSGLLDCAAAALAATPERWPLSPDEVSYFFALGHALRSRLAKDVENISSPAKS